jgi:hypothetical protein
MINECGAVDIMGTVRERKILVENLPHCQFIHYKSHMT